MKKKNFLCKYQRITTTVGAGSGATSTSISGGNFTVYTESKDDALMMAKAKLAGMAGKNDVMKLISVS